MQKIVEHVISPAPPEKNLPIAQQHNLTPPEEHNLTD